MSDGVFNWEDLDDWATTYRREIPSSTDDPEKWRRAYLRWFQKQGYTVDYPKFDARDLRD